MAEEGFKRKLAAILSADVEGYSRLMDDDEEATVLTITSYRNVITDLTQQFRGRVVDSPGDNILTDFTSVVDAVNCAVEIQRDLAERNAELPDNRKMQFRIGVNLGDVIDEDGRLYGDGVNIAARVESLAEAGGICISGRAHDQVENKLGLEYEDLGKHEIKNISRPIQVYRVLSYPGAAAHRVVQAKESVGRRWRKIGFSVAAILIVAVAMAVWQFYMRRPAVKPASVEKMALPLPDKPSIAVLPFDNMSDDPKQEYFSDGITEDIISALSKTEQLFVIARNSTFTYKGKPVKVKQVAEELGVRYVLEGSVRKSEDRVRVTAQLIDATKGHHLWSERYDRELKDIFAVQDEITKNIITELQVKLTSGESVRLLSKGTKNLQAYLRFWQAQEKLISETKEGNLLARRLIKEAITLDPEFPAAYVLLGWTHTNDVMSGVSKSPKKSFAKAMELAKKAIAIDDSYPSAHYQLGWIYIKAREYEKAIAECERAVALAPNDAFSIIWMSLALRYVGRHEEAVGFAEQAVRLSPMPSAFLSRSLGISYMFTGRYEKAIDNFKKALNLAPNDLLTYVNIAVAYNKAGQEDEARAAVAEVIRINPKFSLSEGKKLLNYKNQADNDMYIDALRRAGLPEHAPLPLPDKPSIAVLPFENMSDDPEQEYFSDGITEDIITALSKTPKMFVIARNSTFTYKGKPVKVQEVGRDLGVRYVLEGSVRKVGNEVRITAQLIDAKTGHHLWAEKYDRELKDIFALQDQITMKVLTAVQVAITGTEQALLKQKEPKSLEAYLKILKGRDEWRCQCKEGNDFARNLASEAISLDPEYSAAYFLKSQVHFMGAWLPPFNTSVSESIKRAIKDAQKAVELDSSDALAHGWLGYLYTYPKLYEQAITQGEKAVELAPNSSDAHFYLGTALAYDGRYEEAIEIFKKMFRLNPRQQKSAYHVHIGLPYILSKQYDLAISEYNKATKIAPKSHFPYMMLAPAYVLSGQEKKAREAAEKLLERNPKFSIVRYEKRSPIRKKEDLDRIVEAMRKAGLPD